MSAFHKNRIYQTILADGAHVIRLTIDDGGAELAKIREQVEARGARWIVEKWVSASPTDEALTIEAILWSKDSIQSKMAMDWIRSHPKVQCTSVNRAPTVQRRAARA